MLTYLCYLASSVQPGITIFHYAACVFFDILITVLVVSRLFGSADKQETRRINKLNEAINHDQMMDSFVKQNRHVWSHPNVQAEWKKLQQTENRLRQELKDAGGHESVN